MKQISLFYLNFIFYHFKVSFAKMMLFSLSITLNVGPTKLAFHQQYLKLMYTIYIIDVKTFCEVYQLQILTNN